MKELVFATRDAPKKTIGSPLIARRSPKGWTTSAIVWKDIDAREFLPDVTVVEAGSVISISSLKGLLKTLAAKQKSTVKPAFIVFFFQTSKRPALSKMTEVLHSFSKPDRVEFAWSEDSARIGQIVEAIEPKLEVLQGARNPKAPPQASDASPLDQIKSVLAATRDLRTPKGNLSADRISNLFGVSLSELAKWIGRSRQALTKSPDADAAQDALVPFERIARLRLKLSDSDLRKWLRMPNSQLDGDSPLDAIRAGEPRLVGELVEDVLLGNPA